MEIDIRTMVVMIGITHLIQMTVLIMQYRENRDIDGPGWWLAWTAVETAGFLIILLRVIPEFLLPAKILLNPTLTAGVFCIYIGMLRFFGKVVRGRILGAWYLAYLAVHLFFLFAVDSIEMRTLLFDIVLVVMGVITGVMVLANRTPAIASTAVFNAVIFFIHSGIFTYRSIMIVLGIPVDDIFAPNPFNLVQYVDGFIVGLFWTFGFIIMVNQRLHAGVSEAKAHFEMLFSINPDAATISHARDGLFVDCNESFTRITGYAKSEMIGRSTLDVNLFVNVADRDRTRSLILQQGFCENLEIEFRRKDGSRITGLLSGKLFKVGGEAYIISVTRDISDRKEIERDLQAKNDALQQANAEKDKFYSIIAHDLKSPFNAIIGMSHILREQVRGRESADLDEYADIILQSSQRAMDLLENLTQWSRAHTGRMPFIPERFDFNELIDELVLFYTDIAGQKSITLEQNIAPGLTTHADRSMIGTVLRNLVSNAIKFTHPGGRVTIRAHADGNGLLVSVEDTGVGISEELQARLFRLDGNLSTAGTRNESGTGLGLILCKEFIELHDGVLHVQSRTGHGSTFSFTLPALASLRAAL